jgi:3alpha(or 20beta)-hydroxysteroid dehydrogenase
MGLLAGRRAFVTGAARGIGLATAERFAAEGASVALVDRDEAEVARAAAGVPGALALTADVCDEGGMELAVAEAEDQLGGLDVVIANAGVEPSEDDRADRLDVAVWRHVIDTNLTGAFVTAKFGLRALLRSGATDRNLIFTLSPTGLRGSARGQDAYSASKAGVMGLMRVLAADCAPERIRVNGVMPGFTRTRANASLLADANLLAQTMLHIPLGRPGTPAEVASSMAWLASEEATYITGAALTVDGGQTAI